LYLATLLPFSKIVSIKWIPVGFEFAAGYTMYRMVKEKYQGVGKTPFAMPVLTFVMGCALLIVAMDVVANLYAPRTTELPVTD
jgi:Gpi18-like mannosyltransferase